MDSSVPANSQNIQIRFPFLLFAAAVVCITINNLIGATQYSYVPRAYICIHTMHDDRKNAAKQLLYYARRISFAFDYTV